MEAEELNDFFRPMKPEDIAEMVDSPAFQSLPEYIRERWESAKELPDGRRWYVWIGSNGNPHELTMRLDEFMECATEQAEMNAKGLFRACEVTHLVSRHKKMDSAETKEFMRGLQMAVKVGELPFVRCGSDFAYQPDENEKLHSGHYFRREDLDAWLSKIGNGYTLPVPEAQAKNSLPQPAQAAPAAVAESVPNLDHYLTTSQIATVFDGVPFKAESWSQRLSDTKWIQPAKRSAGERGGASAMWCPLALAKAILARKKDAKEKAATLKTLKALFKQRDLLAPHRAAWGEYLQLISDD